MDPAKSGQPMAGPAVCGVVVGHPHHRFYPHPGWWPWAAVLGGFALVAAGVAIYLTCLWEFLLRGRGIPAPLDHPTELVVTGLYRFVRNPMYVGGLLVLLGEAMFFGSWACLWYALGWFALVHLNVIWYEERYLTRRFGDSYRRYQVAVRRWIPGLPYRPAA